MFTISGLTQAAEAAGLARPQVLGGALDTGGGASATTQVNLRTTVCTAAAGQGLAGERVDQTLLLSPTGGEGGGTQGGFRDEVRIYCH